MGFSKTKILTLGLATATLALMGCSKNSDDASTAAALGISGTLSVSSGSQKISLKNGDVADAQAVTDYTAVCATTSAPILSGTGPVASDGTFSVSITGANGQPIACYLIDADGEKVADFLVEDSTKKDLNGNNERVNTINPVADVAMGSISFDESTGEVTVPAANVASSTTSTVTGEVFDPTGAWTIGAVDFTLPSGVRSTCTAAEQSANTCNGPPEGVNLYLKRWTGSIVSSGNPIYGLQVWEGGESAFTNCGSKVGLSTAQKTEIGVDFSANGSADAEFTFATSVANFTDNVTSTTSNVTLTDNWKMNTATLRWDLYPLCGPVDLTIGSTTYDNAWRCGPDTSGDYQIGLSGGCVKTADNSPVQVNDWSGMSCSSATNGDGIQTSTCTGNATVNSVSTAVSCKNSWAVVNSSNVVQPSGSFNYSEMNASRITSGTNCSAIGTGTEPLAIATLQCYANYYWQSGMAQSSACLPRVDTDWSASTAAEFIKKDFRPNSMVFFEQFKPFADGSGGTILTRQEHFRGVQVAGGNSWVNCKVIDTGGLAIKKISDTRLLAMYQSSEVTASTAKPICMAEFSGKKKTFIFYLNK